MLVQCFQLQDKCFINFHYYYSFGHSFGTKVLFLLHVGGPRGIAMLVSMKSRKMLAHIFYTSATYAALFMMTLIQT